MDQERAEEWPVMKTQSLISFMSMKSSYKQDIFVPGMGFSVLFFTEVSPRALRASEHDATGRHNEGGRSGLLEKSLLGWVVISILPQIKFRQW